jgi:hypothetical protein
MGASLVEIDGICFEKTRKLLLMEDQEVIQAFSSHPSQKALIHPDFFHAGEDPFERFQKQWDALPILDVRFMNDHIEDKTRRISEKMSLPA